MSALTAAQVGSRQGMACLVGCRVRLAQSVVCCQVCRQHPVAIPVGCTVTILQWCMRLSHWFAASVDMLLGRLLSSSSAH